MCSRIKPKHWLIRVQDGKNFKNSKYPFWGVKKNGGGNTVKKRFNEGDILWFITSKSYGGRIIGMSEYTCYYDRQQETLISIYTYSNKEQNWEGDEDWSIQIHYKNLYLTEKQNLEAIVQCGGNILEYETFKDRGLPDLYKHYEMFKFYGEPKIFNKN